MVVNGVIPLAQTADYICVGVVGVPAFADVGYVLVKTTAGHKVNSA